MLAECKYIEPNWFQKLVARFKDRWQRFKDRNKPTVYETKAILEFRAAGWMDDHGKFKDDMQELMCNQVLELLKVFNTHGHSGTSAPYAIQLFETLAKFKPVVPLTGEDWEWLECGDGVFQNRRYSEVFKKDGQAYNSNGKIFRLPDGCCYGSRDSRVNIEFPYTPKTEYVDVEK